MSSNQQLANSRIFFEKKQTICYGLVGSSLIIIGSLAFYIWYSWHISWMVTVYSICFHVPGQNSTFSALSLYLITPWWLECTWLSISFISDRGITIFSLCHLHHSVCPEGLYIHWRFKDPLSKIIFYCGFSDPFQFGIHEWCIAEYRVYHTGKIFFEGCL